MAQEATIKFFDMFAGIGGFRAGLERAGGFSCIGHSEIDKHAHRAYQNLYTIDSEEVFYENAKTINAEEMPDFDLLCAGFPCQSFSVAGKRRGFKDARGTLFFDIARVLKAKQPAFFLLENVPGLLSHDEGRTFTAIISTLSELGYGVEWQVLNSKHFGVPQSRRRLYIVGYIDPKCAGKILPLPETGGKALIQITGGAQGERIYDPSGIACTQLASSGGGGGKTGLYLVSCSSREGVSGARDSARTLTASYYKGITANQGRDGVLLVKAATARGYSEAMPGDSVDISFAGQNKKHSRVGRGIAHTLTTNAHQAVVEGNLRIRRLTPRECLRLQGFSEEQIDKLLAVTSDTQAYRQAGNAVTVNVVHALALSLKAAHAAAVAASGAEKEAA